MAESGFFDTVGRMTGIRRRGKVARYQLTEIGEDRIEKLDAGSIKSQLLVSIKKLQPASSVREISEDLHWPLRLVKDRCEILESEELIEKV